MVDVAERISPNSDFLRSLLSIPSPTGNEHRAAFLWREYAKPFASDVWADPLGNSFASWPSRTPAHVMLAGHIDEIGVMISAVDEHGYLAFVEVGGWDPQIFPGQRVRIKTINGLILGVIGRKPIHLLEEDDRKKVVKPTDLWIDIGAQDEVEARKIVSIGDYGVIDYGFEDLGRNDRVVGRGIDDRIGAFVVLEALRATKEMYGETSVTSNIVAVATVQEEIGLRGGMTSAFGLGPKVGIAVDVGFATDTPGMDDARKKVGKVEVGKGPIVTRGPNINPRLFELIVQVAASHDIPIQVVAFPRGTGTDANAIQVSGAGVAAALISIPNRYMHSPCELISMKDVDHAIHLIAHTVNEIMPSTDFTV